MNADTHRNTSGISSLELILAVTLLVLLGGFGFLFIASRHGGRTEPAPGLLETGEGGRSHGVVGDLGRAPMDDAQDGPGAWNGRGDSGSPLDATRESTPGYHVTARTSGIKIGQELRDFFEPALGDSGRPDWSSFMSLVSRLDPAQLPEAWALLQEQPWSSEKQDIMKAFVTNWAQQDPEAAMEFALSLTSSNQRRLAYGVAVKTWAMTDPEAAIEWYEAAVAKDERMPSQAFFAGLHATHPEVALEMIWDFDDPRRSREMLKHIFFSEDSDRESGAASAKALFDVEEDPERRTVLAKIVADVWALKDPMRAIAWAQELEDDPDAQYGIYMAAAQSWGRREPEATMTWLQETGIEDVENGVVHQITRSWSHDDPASLGQWIDSTPPSALKDSVIATEVRHLQQRDPATAMALAESLSQEADRYKAMASVADQWMRKNKNEAATAILASSMPPDMKRKYAMKVIPKDWQKKSK